MKLFAILLFTLLVSRACYGVGTTWYVDINGNGDFYDIQSAVDAADSGDIIVVNPGIYTNSNPSHVLLDTGKPLTIQSIEPNNPEIVESTIILADDFYEQIGFATEGIPAVPPQELFYIDGFTFSHFNQAIAISDDGDPPLDISITNCNFQNNLRSVAVNDVAGGMNLSIQNCIFEFEINDQVLDDLYEVYARHIDDVNCNGVVLEVVDCVFVNTLNTNDMDPCNVYNTIYDINNCNGSSFISGCTFTRTEPYYIEGGSCDGGYAYIDGHCIYTDDAIIENCELNGNGINIDADWLLGPYHGIHVSGTSSINNTTISGFQEGIYLGGENNLTITETNITNCQTGVGAWIEEGDQLDIFNCYIQNNGSGLNIYFYYDTDPLAHVNLFSTQITKNQFGVIYSTNGGRGAGEIRFTNCNVCSNAIGNLYCNEGSEDDCENVLIVDMGGNNFATNCNGTGSIHVPDNYETIEEAVSNAFEGDEIIIAPGIYQIESTLHLNSGVTLRGSGLPENTIIDAQNNKRIFTTGNYYYAANNTIDGLTFINGFLDYSDYSGGGAAGSIRSANLSLYNCIFENNHSYVDNEPYWSSDGGGALNFRFDAYQDEQFHLLIDNCTFRDNSSSRGGAIHIIEPPLYDYNGDTVSISIQNSIFDSNQALDNANESMGGAIFIIGNYSHVNPKSKDFGETTITNCVFNNNGADTGGSVDLGGVNTQVITDCTFNTNNSNISGGAINIGPPFMNYYPVQIDFGSEFYNCLFINNTSTDRGGAIRLESGSSGYDGYHIFSKLINCEFENNLSEKGGAVYVGVYGSKLTCSNQTTFRENEGFEGGAIYLENALDFYPENSLQINDCYFEGNNAIFGGGILGGDWGETPIQNSIFSGNTSVFGSAIYNNANNLNLLNCEFKSNDGEYGGAIYNRLGTISLDETLMSENNAWQGGAIFNTEGLAAISNSGFIGNVAEDSGGGIYNLISYAQISNSTFCSNEAGMIDTEDIYGAWIDEGNTIITDECEDCDGNGSPDWEEIYQNASLDCNMNLLLDWCEIEDDPLLDCNRNGVPDECDIANGTEDCNNNGILDECETDCDENGVPDECDIASGAADCNNNGILDECETDCNENGVPDDCDIANGDADDCNNNGVPDYCDILSGESQDTDLDGIPDECQCLSDVNNDSVVDVVDVLIIIGAWGSCDDCVMDVNNDGSVDVNDLLIVISDWGEC